MGLHSLRDGTATQIHKHCSKPLLFFAIVFSWLDNVSQMPKFLARCQISTYIMALLCPFESSLNVEIRQCSVLPVQLALQPGYFK